MKKKSIIVYLCLLMLLIKPYVDINYSEDFEENNLIGSYSFGYTCGNCSRGFHGSCNYISGQTSYSCGSTKCCCGYINSSISSNHWYKQYSNYHRKECSICGFTGASGDHYDYSLQGVYENWWGPGGVCSACGYTYSSGAGSTHTCSYTDSYNSYGSGGHYAYCTCGKYITQSHSMYYCCSNGKYCNKCGYKDHTESTVTHTCSYTNSYNSYGSGGHYAVCICGNSITQSHSMGTCCSNGSVCQLCGYKDHSNCHTHSYNYSFTSYGSGGHYAYCSCGSSITQTHYLINCCNNGQKCQLCGYKDHSTCGTGLHICSYNSHYNTYTTSQHIAFCSCGNSIYESHTLTDCCSSGKWCSKCGYKDHNTCHIHNYTNSYTTYGSAGHYAYCACGSYTTQGHTLSSVETCGYQYCTKNCGYSISDHNYTSSYVNYGSSGHYAYCACGLRITQTHSTTTLSCGYQYCTKNCGYSSGSHKYTVYTNNGVSGHTASCSCGSSITEAHTLTTLSCGYSYCSTGCGYETNSHNYTYSYKSYGDGGHYAYCSCGAYISKGHTLTNCCYDGKVCSICGYKDHSPCHTHLYNNVYEQVDTNNHKAYCRCGISINETHTLGPCCSFGSKCIKCGYKNHTICISTHTTHTFTYEDYGDSTNHKAVCTYALCGYTTLEAHEQVVCCQYGNKCSKCGYKYGHSCEPPVVECTHIYMYNDYNNSENHEVSCSICLSNLGYESHLPVYCCEGGNKCSKCGYMYGHTCIETHEHDYTAAYTIKNEDEHRAYCTCDQYIEESHEMLNGECIKCGYDANLVAGIAGGTPNNPVLPDGMIPVKWDDSKDSWIVTDINDYEWYDYNNQKWPNVTLRDGLAIEGGNASTGTIEELKGKKVTTPGSMFVWIPRYTYKNNGNGVVSIYFSNGTEDYTEDKYLASPAFYYGEYLGGNPSDNSNYTNRNGKNNELAGIWVAKFMASNNNSHIDIKPNKTIYTADINTIFNLAKQMTSDSTYGLKSSQATTHMMKASEWSAVSYLTSAVGEIPYINNTVKSGYSGMSLNASSSDTSYLWDTTQGGMASTTRNITGIFDMSGARNEYTASYITIAGNPNISGAVTLSSNAKDVDKIDMTSAKSISIVNLLNYKLALAEVMNWNSDEFIIPTTSSSIFTKGGNNTQKEKAGIFATGSADDSETLGFRPVILVFDTIENDTLALLETETSVIPGGNTIINLQFSTNETSWKMGKTLGNLFVPDASTGKRAADIYMTEFNNSSENVYELNQSVVSIVKDGVAMTNSQLSAINENTVFGAGNYQIKVSIGGYDRNGKEIFENGKVYKVMFGGLNFIKTAGGALNISGIDLNIVKLSVVGVSSNEGGSQTPENENYQIVVKQNINGTISPAIVTISSGSNQSFVIKADTGYRVNDVKVNGISIGSVTGYTFTNVTSNQSITATFVSEN